VWDELVLVKRCTSTAPPGKQLDKYGMFRNEIAKRWVVQNKRGLEERQFVGTSHVAAQTMLMCFKG
jgi:hypothetical protein